MLFSKEKATQLARIAELEESLTALTTAHTELQAHAASAATAHAEALAALTAQHTAAMQQAEATATEARERAIIDALASAGVPERSLPTQSAQGTAETVEELEAKLNALEKTDAKARGEIADKLRKARAAAN